MGDVETEHHPHRRRLAGAVGAEEAGDDAGLHGEGEVGNGGGVAVALGEFVDIDHDSIITIAVLAVVRSTEVCPCRDLLLGE